MATITLGMVSAPLTASKTYTGTDADMQALLTWAKSYYDPWIQKTFNPGKNPAFVATNAQAGAAIANDFISRLIEAVKNANTTQVVTVPPPMTWA